MGEKRQLVPPIFLRSPFRLAPLERDFAPVFDGRFQSQLRRLVPPTQLDRLRRRFFRARGARRRLGLFGRRGVRLGVAAGMRARNGGQGQPAADRPFAA